MSIGKIKTYTLSLLIISGLFLCGSLWFENYHGFSDFMAKMRSIQLFNINKNSTSIPHSQLFIPNSIILNDGEEGHWVLYPSGHEFDFLWQNTKDILNQINSKTEGQSITSDEWDELILKKSGIVKFNYPLTEDILPIILKPDVKIINDKLLNVTEMAITQFGENSNFYVKIKKEDKYIYKRFSFSNLTFIEDEYFEQITQKPTNIKYATLTETLGSLNESIFYNPDVLVPIFSFSNQNGVPLTQIDFAPYIDTQNTQQLNSIALKLLKGPDYTYFIKNDGSHIFIDQEDTTIKISPIGCIELDGKRGYTPTQKFNLENSLSEAIDLILKLKKLDNLYITNIYLDSLGYNFEFGFSLKEIPVLQSNSTEVFNPLKITIDKSSRKLIWYMRDYKTIEGDYVLASDHDVILNAIFEKEAADDISIKIDDIALIYNDDGKITGRKPPEWLVRYSIAGENKWLTVISKK